MGSPTSDDDPTRAGGQPPGQGGWPPPAQGGSPGQYGQYPPPGQEAQYPAPGQYPAQGPAPTAQFPAQGPAPTAQFPQAGGYPGGGYPPGGPGGPYPPQGPGGGYGAPPPSGGGNRRGLLIALVAGLVILAGIAVALVVAFTREGGQTASAEPSTESSSEAPSSSPSPSPSETSASPSPSPSADRTDELLAMVPADFTDCEPTEPAGDGDVAAVFCGPSTTQPGPQDGTFYLYEDTATLDRVFAEDSSGLDPMPEGADCMTAQGVTTWNVEGVEGGEVACTITEDGLLLAWTDREFGIEGIVTAPGTTQEELAALAQWWATNSDYQG